MVQLYKVTYYFRQGGQQTPETLEDPKNLGFCLPLGKYPGKP